MKFDIKSRFDERVIFTAEIEADESTSYGARLGMAVRVAVRANANLNGADLDGANLDRASLNGANLDRASLDGADLNWASLEGASLNRANLNRASLNGASLNGADLYEASLFEANLNRASLEGANLEGASLEGANLEGASLNGAILDGANLNRADLNGASLNGANLNRASLNGASGINDWVKCIQIEDWPITYTSDVMQIGCQRHSLGAWRDFDDAAILLMDGRRSLAFWRKWKAWIFQTIDMCPAKATGYVAPTSGADAPADEEAE